MTDEDTVVSAYLDVHDLDGRDKSELASQAHALIARGSWSVVEASAAARAFAHVGGRPRDFALWAAQRRKWFVNFWSDR